MRSYRWIRPMVPTSGLGSARRFRCSLPPPWNGPMIRAGKEPAMVELKSRQILVMCGEIHYFRLLRGEWESRIRTLASAGCAPLPSCTACS